MHDTNLDPSFVIDWIMILGVGNHMFEFLETVDIWKGVRLVIVQDTSTVSRLCVFLLNKKRNMIIISR